MSEEYWFEGESEQQSTIQMEGKTQVSRYIQKEWVKNPRETSGQPDHVEERNKTGRTVEKHAVVVS